MHKHEPIETLEVLDTLNETELLAGYIDGFDGHPEPDHATVSLSWWHGWRNGAMDGKHIPHDAPARALARLYITRSATASADALAMK